MSLHTRYAASLVLIRQVIKPTYSCLCICAGALCFSCVEGMQCSMRRLQDCSARGDLSRLLKR